VVTKLVQNLFQHALTLATLIAEKALRNWRGSGAPTGLEQLYVSGFPPRLSCLIAAFRIDVGRVYHDAHNISITHACMKEHIACTVFCPLGKSRYEDAVAALTSEGLAPL
jgi:hypothetical protein